MRLKIVRQMIPKPKTIAGLTICDGELMKKQLIEHFLFIVLIFPFHFNNLTKNPDRSYFNEI